MTYKTIPLTRDFVTIVDEADYDWLNQWKWHCDSLGYARRNSLSKDGNKGTSIKMHRLIMNTPDGMETDHINGNKIDNRRSNLRVCTKSQNQANSKSICISSDFKGVGYHKKDKRWRARIKHDGKVLFIGNFISEKEAALAYNKAAIQYHGEFAHLNTI